MSHDPHTGPEGAVLYDNCGECDYRATKALAGLLSLDAERFSMLALRMLAVEYGEERERYRYLTDNEARLGQALYHVSLLMQRHPRMFEVIDRRVRRPVAERR